MSLSELEQHVFAMAPKYSPYGELALIIEDRIVLGVRKFGMKAEFASRPAARAFLDLQLERGGFSTTKDDLSTMHQYQSEPYQTCVADLQASDPIIQKAKAGGATFWQDAFAALK
jgi:hypothetical protein